MEKALLVAVQTPDINTADNLASLAELSRLVHTLGYQVVGQLSQKQGSTKKSNVVGEGMLQKIATWTDGPGVVGPMVVRKKSKAAERFGKEKEDESEDETDAAENSEEEELETPKEKAQIVIFDCDLSPSQLRNLESASGVKVLDRTGVIIEIFSRHARTKSARLQVEIARLTYLAPRLRETGGGEDRGGGGVGGKGSGETSLELDKRQIRDKIKELKGQLQAVNNEHLVRRARRDQEITVALVGYTNAGKSSLMRALTGSEVLIADKLFATLDTTIRPLFPESRPKILISDTVGFIKKLPHDLVASFKSTLDEALNASLLLYVVDSSDPSFRSQLGVTQSVLSEVGVTDTPTLLILNKRDNLTVEQTQVLQNEFPDAVLISTRDKNDVKNLREKIIEHFEEEMVDLDILIPFSVQGAIGEVRKNLKVLQESYSETGSLLKVRGNEEKIAQIKKKFNL